MIACQTQHSMPQLQSEQTSKSAALGHSKVKECILHRNQGNKTGREAADALCWTLKNKKKKFKVTASL